MDLTLVIMAAGMGSRFKGHKQLEGVGPSNELLMDYSIFDARKAGFKKVVVVVRKSFLSSIEKILAERWGNTIAIEYVCQELEDLPKPYALPVGREKPWGTVHALLCCEGLINNPFTIINADDFYGAAAFYAMEKYLNKLANSKNNLAYNTQEDVVNGAMVGYELQHTLSLNGSVTRGLCEIEPQTQTLQKIEELQNIYLQSGRVFYKVSDQESEVSLRGNELVSMNMWGFSNTIFTVANNLFKEFLAKNILNLKAEFVLPVMVNSLINNASLQVEVLQPASQWFGMTYQEDKNKTTENISQLIKSGAYPKKLG